MNWLVLSLLTASIWGISPFFAKKGFENISPLWTNIISGIAAVFIFIPTALLFGNINFSQVTMGLWILALLVSAAYYMYFYAVSKGEVSLTATIISGYPLSTILLSHLFLSERLSSFQLGAVLIIITSIVLIAMPDRVSDKIIKDRSWVWWGVASALIIGSGDFLSKFIINKIGSFSYLIMLAIAYQVISILNYLIDPNGRRLPEFKLKKFIPTLVGAFSLVLGTNLFFIAMGKNLASLVVPISSVYPVITVTLGIIFLKERISFKQGFGIAGVILGVIMLSLNVN